MTLFNVVSEVGQDVSKFKQVNLSFYNGNLIIETELEIIPKDMQKEIKEKKPPRMM